MAEIKEIYPWLKKNGLLSAGVIIPSVLAIVSHSIAAYSFNGDGTGRLYNTAPYVDIITHFLGAYAISKIAEKLYKPLSKKYRIINRMSEDKFAIGTTLALGSLNEIGERIISTLPGMHVIGETLENSIRDMFVDAIGTLAQRYIRHKKNDHRI